MPTPLYELYRRDWGLSPGEITLVFAMFASSLVPSLLFSGGISDEIGRRKTLLIALGFSALGSLVFAFADGLWWLIAGRILQGIAIGIGLGTGAAAVREWMDVGMQRLAGEVVLIGTGIGATVGAILGGVLGQYAPFPTTLPFIAHIVTVACVAAAVASVPSCPHLGSAGHHGLPSIPLSIRRPFYLAATEAFIGWATVAIFASLIPSFLVRSLDLHNLLVGAGVVTLVQTGLVTAALIAGWLAQPRRHHRRNTSARRWFMAAVDRRTLSSVSVNLHRDRGRRRGQRTFIYGGIEHRQSNRGAGTSRRAALGVSGRDESRLAAMPARKCRRTPSRPVDHRLTTRNKIRRLDYKSCEVRCMQMPESSRRHESR